MKYKLFPIFLVLLSVVSCSEIKTDNVNEVYEYWSGTADSDSNVKLIQGEYWQSGHFTKEYIMYLEILPKKIWWNEFVKQNNLIIDTVKDKYLKEREPDWFKPSGNSIKYKTDSGFDQGSRYYIEPKTGICFFYEIQL